MCVYYFPMGKTRPSQSRDPHIRARVSGSSRLDDMRTFLDSFNAQQDQVTQALYDVKKLQKQVDSDIDKNMRRLSLTQNAAGTLSTRLGRQRRNSICVGEEVNKWDLLRQKGVQMAQEEQIRAMLESKMDTKEGKK